MFLNIRYRGTVVVPSQGQDIEDTWICQWLCWLIVGFATLVVCVTLFTQRSAIGYLLGFVVIVVAGFVVFCCWMRSLYLASVERTTMKTRNQDRRAHTTTVIRIPPETSTEAATIPRSDQPVPDDPPSYETVTASVPTGERQVQPQ